MGGRSQEEVAMDDAVAARIEGKINLINERHERYTQDITDVKTRLNGHSERLNTIETWYHKAAGASSAIKLVWLIGGAICGTALTVGIAMFSYLTNGG